MNKEIKYDVISASPIYKEFKEDGNRRFHR